MVNTITREKKTLREKLLEMMPLEPEMCIRDRAVILGISLPTVKYHKKKIFARIGVKNTAEAIQWMNNQKKLVKR